MTERFARPQGPSPHEWQPCCERWIYDRGSERVIEPLGHANVPRRAARCAMAERGEKPKNKHAIRHPAATPSRPGTTGSAETGKVRSERLRDQRLDGCRTDMDQRFAWLKVGSRKEPN